MEGVMNNFSEDMIIQILLRLSVKSLLRFRCVCINWFILIKSPDFINMHLNHPTARNDHHVLLKRCLEDEDKNVLSIHSNQESLATISPDLEIPHFDCESLKVMGPCNGLVCISNTDIIDFCIACYEIIVLCNPAMKEFILLPERPFGCPEDLRVFYKGVGFGFDASTNDYKVVRIVNIEDEDDTNDFEHVNILKVEVYQCSTDSWREIDTALPDLHFAYCYEIFFHGATYWDAYSEDDEDDARILTFNITTEVFQEFGIPDECKPKSKSLAVLNQFLAMLAYKDTWLEPNQMIIDVWTMREYGISESWTKQFSIGPLSEMLHPITYWKNSAILVERTNGQLLSCAADTQEIKEFNIFGYPRTLQALVYKESLISMRK